MESGELRRIARRGQGLLLTEILVLLFAGGASVAEVSGSAEFSAWVERALIGKAEGLPKWAVGLELVRQDHAELQLRQSVLKTPLKIGNQPYEHGLGTHAVSEIVVRLERPGKTFSADVGIDNNHDTAGVRGSVIFMVQVEGNVAFQTEVCRGGQPAVPVRVELGGVRQFTLRVLDADDNQYHDQADWAAAMVTYEDGKQQWLDEMPMLKPSVRFMDECPFLFSYGGKNSRELLPKWTRRQEGGQSQSGRPIDRIMWKDPASGLEVVCELTQFKEYSAVDWVLRLRNTGTSDSPIIENIRPLDLRLSAPPKAGDLVLHHAHGSTCSANDFLPLTDIVTPKADIQLAPRGGRSSDGHLPFFNLQWPEGGLIAAIGWSGQWCARVHREASQDLRVEAGLQFARFRLRPGESVRTPRILLVGWKGGDRYVGHNQLRRLLIDRYLPRINGEVVVPPVTHNTWFTFNEGNGVTEANQSECIPAMARTGVECYWLDAGWFEGGWPTGVGSWVPKAEAFPRGLKPVGDAAHAAGMKFVLWFEPERVNLKSRIAREHPEWLLHPLSGDPREHPEWVIHAGGGDGVFNLGDPAARAWLTDYLSRCISEWGIDVYRNDFNIDPLRFWQKADEPDRQGIPEIRYIEGLYAMWDELLRRHPGILIDNCASGGRRIDLEMMMRSVPLWRSDTSGAFTYPLPTQDQVQTAGLSLWVPFHSAGIWSFDPYVYRSVATTGINISQDARAKDYPADAACKAIAEIKRLRPMWMGDFYPLLDINLDERQWSGWQLNRADLGRGCVFLFRRSQSPYAAVSLNLRGINPRARYEVLFTDENRREQLRGEELSRITIAVPSAPGCSLVEYVKMH